MDSSLDFRLGGVRGWRPMRPSQAGLVVLDML